ncbi:MAG: hypothetical protein ABJC62_07880, partial [Frankiaceae bacterium]
MLTAVAAEADAVLAALTATGSLPGEPVRIGPYPACGTSEVTVLAGGIGPAAAAAATASALALQPETSLVLSAGIAGGFAEAGVGVGDLVLADSSVFADLGADSPRGFHSAAELRWAAPTLPPSSAASAVAEALRNAGLPVHQGLVLT